MKRVLMVLMLFMAGFTLTSCGLETDFIDEIKDGIDDVQSAVDDLKADMAALQDEIDELTALLEGMQSGVDDEFEALKLELEALKAQLEKTTHITIAHTNDIHGRFEEGRGSMGFAHVKSVVEMLKLRNPNTLLVDAGDTFHGTVFANLEMGHTIADLMNMVGYDYHVPGNHDFNFGYEHLLTLRDYADFPFLSANVYKDDERLFNPYMIHNIDGVDVGFFGLTSPETVFKTHPDNVEGLVFTDPVDEAQIVVSELEDLVDVVILISHVGTAEDTLVTTHDVATEVDGIHLIIDGHSHDVPAMNEWVNDTLIVSAHEYLKYVGYVDIIVVDGEVISLEAHAIGAEEAVLLGQDWAILQYISAAKEAQEELLNEVVGFTNVRIEGAREYVRTQETNSGNLLTDAMQFVSGADIVITNGGGIRDSFEAGDITLGDVISMLPFGNIVVTKELTGAEIIEVLETVTADFTGDNEIGSFPHVAGISYTIDLNLAEDRITDVMYDGDPIDPDAVYVVATNDFIAAGGDNYPHMADRPMIAEYGTMDAALIDFITFLEDLNDYEFPQGRILIIHPDND